MYVFYSNVIPEAEFLIKKFQAKFLIKKFPLLKKKNNYLTWFKNGKNGSFHLGRRNEGEIKRTIDENRNKDQKTEGQSGHNDQGNDLSRQIQGIEQSTLNVAWDGFDSVDGFAQHVILILLLKLLNNVEIHYVYIQLNEEDLYCGD